MTQSPETRPSLLLRLRGPRDERAWADFLEIYEPLVYRLACRRGWQDSDAREITQEVLLAVAGAIDRWQPAAGQGSFRAWLFRIARNVSINYLLKQGRRERGSGDSGMQRWLEQQPAAADEDSSLFDGEYRRQLFRWAAEQIRDEFKPSTWQAFWKTCVEGRRIAEVAAELDLSPGAIYVARSRVVARLKQEIQAAESQC